MTLNNEQKLQQLENRIAISELIDQYAFCGHAVFNGHFF